MAGVHHRGGAAGVTVKHSYMWHLVASWAWVIGCQLLACVIVLGSLRLVELKVGGGHNAKTIMEEMRNLNRVLSWRRGARMAWEQIEEPIDRRAHILARLRDQVKDGSVLQLAS